MGKCYVLTFTDLRIALLCRRVGKKEQESAEATDFPSNTFRVRWEKKGKRPGENRALSEEKAKEKSLLSFSLSPPL